MLSAKYGDSDEDVRQVVLANARRPCSYDVRAAVPRPPVVRLRPPIDFEAAETAWRLDVRKYGVAQSGIYTTKSNGQRCELSIDACMCMVCMRKRVLG